MAFGLIYAPLFAKTYRIPKMKKVVMTDRDVFKLSSVVLLLFVVILATWSSIGMPYQVADCDANMVRYEHRHSSKSWLPIIPIVLESFLLGWGSMLCYRVHAIHGEFEYLNEVNRLASVFTMRHSLDYYSWCYPLGWS